MADAFVPYIPPEKRLPEVTIKGLILGVILAVILGAANTYLGLRVGLTVSATIPAAVVSMGLLRWFRQHNILENNMVMTVASAGEALAAGVLFTIPALLILGHWTEIHYLETALVALTGGTLGVLFTIPLRRALIVEEQLAFPEGIATAEVLKAGEGGGGAGLVALVIGAATGALYKFLQTGTKMWTESAQFGTRFRDNGVIAFGADLSPALLGVGYIIGLHIAVLVFMGGALGWIVAIPIYSLFGDAMVQTEPGVMVDFTTVGNAVDTAGFLWSHLIRYIGVGAMLVGGIWSLIKLRKPLGKAMKQGLAAGASGGSGASAIRTEQDISIRATFLGVLVLTLPLAGLYWFASGQFYVAAILGVIMLVTGFLFSAVAGYMAGLVGSSNNPISGVTILTVLAAAFSLKLLGVSSDIGPAATILVAGTIASAAAIAGDNLQDLKSGWLVGATPKKQQAMLIVGVVASGLALPLILKVLTDAYELGSAELAAPQAGLMAAVSKSVFEGGLPWTMVGIGAAMAVALIIIDEIQIRRGAKFRTPVMPVAVGIYLPVGLSVPIFLGGVIAWITARMLRGEKWTPVRTGAGHNGVLFASGLIAGEALIGILLAAIIIGGGEEALALGSGALRLTGLLMFGYVALLMWYIVVRPRFVKAS